MDEQNTNTAIESGENTPDTGTVKTFTQDDVDRIVQERLIRERAKYDRSFAQKEQELERRALVLTAKEKLAAKGLSSELADALNISTPEQLDASLSIIEKFVSQQKSTAPSPSVPLGVPGIGGNPAPAFTPPGDDMRKAMGLKR